MEKAIYKSPRSLKLENGQIVEQVTLAYETYGKLNVEKNNAVLICHALTGDAHASSVHTSLDKPGWWDNMIGQGKAFDTEQYFVICSNVLGGCSGSTGPSSINSASGKPYGLGFPIITVGDMVEAQKGIIDHLGIERLLAVAGGSMGGMQVLAWLAKYPDRLASAVPIATAIRHSPQQIAFNEVGRQAIMADPDWKEGDYYGGLSPIKGLSLARMIGHITYMSDTSMTEKFGRQRSDSDNPFKFNAEFEVEHYLHNRGENFVRRFDANSYLYITRAIDNFDASGGQPFHQVLRKTNARLLVIAFKSDWLYPAYQSKEIVKAGKQAGLDVTYCEINSTYGHDAFLLESDEETHLIKHFLKRVLNGGNRNGKS
jgi:homoserine O-acetyltransferase/O-succinyltransferase